MRLKVELIITGNGRTLPINYQYPLSAWIYKTLHHANPEFSAWLHSHGYSFENRQFKLFTFSNLSFEKSKVSGDRLTSLSDSVSLIISFLVPETVQHFVRGCFINQRFRLGDYISQLDLQVRGLEILPSPLFQEEMSFETMSPVCISQSREGEGIGSCEYLSPVDERYGLILKENLIRKHIAFNGGEGFGNDFSFMLLSEPRSKLISVIKDKNNPIRFRAYHYRFKIKATPELVKMGYYAGFGEKNSMGCGCVKLIETVNDTIKKQGK